MQQQLLDARASRTDFSLYPDKDEVDGFVNASCQHPVIDTMS